MPHRGVTRDEFERIVGRIQAINGVLQQVVAKKWTTGQKLAIVQQVIEAQAEKRSGGESHGFLECLDELLQLPHGAASKLAQQK